MSGDLLFYVFALTAVAAAIAAASLRDLRRAGHAMLLLLAALAGCSALLGAGVVAALQAGVALVAAVASRRHARRMTAGDGMAADAAAGDASAEDAAAEGVPVHDDAGADAGAATTDDRVAAAEAVARAAAEDAPVGRIRAAMLVLAFFVLVSRAVLMTRWPLAGAAATPVAAPVAAQGILQSLPPAGLPHFLVVGLLLFCIGLFAGITRRSVAGVGLGVQAMTAAAVLGLVAVSHFVGGAHDGRTLAALVVVLSAAATAVALRGGSGRVTTPTAGPAADVLSTMLAAITVALLAGAWG